MNNLDIHIVGLGNLGSALLQGLVNLDKNLTFHLYEKEGKINDFIKKEFNLDTKLEIDLIENGVLILCIKPKDLNDFIETNKDKISEDVLICTVLAGVETSYISKFISNKIIRLMPNLSIRDNNGFIPYTKNYEEDYLSFLELLKNLGSIAEYDEELFHIITAIYGSGPAWYLDLSSKIVEAATELGLSKSESNKIINELLKSLPSLVSEEEFSDTVEKIKSPKGTTEAGINSLMNDSFDKIIFNAINSATERSIEISKEINDE